MNEKAYQTAVRELLQLMSGNRWFVGEHWPLNEPHVRHMVDDMTRYVEPTSSHHILDVGCFNGYISYLFRRLGYRVTGADNANLDDRNEIFAANDIGFVQANFNSLDPMPEVPNDTYDGVILAQVIEHILNQPAGFIGELARVTRPGGLLIVTTPQPASIMNASRLLLGRWSMWGTEDFMHLPKIENGDIIAHPEIHYREYLSRELVEMVESAGYEVLKTRYLGLGASAGQAGWKRLVKSNPVTQWLMTKRLFASNQYVLARKRAT